MTKKTTKYTLQEKASKFVQGLHWGKGGQDRMVTLMQKFLGQKCKYCDKIVTLENCSLDHKTPVLRSKLSTMPKEQIDALNSADNLQLLTRDCNKAKGKIPDEKFQKLMDFLDTDPILKVLVWEKLRQSQMIWSFRKH